MFYMTFISLLPTFSIAIFGMIYILVAFKLFLSFSSTYENEFGVSNLPIGQSLVLSSLWFPLTVLVVAAIVLVIIGAKVAYVKYGT